MFILVDAMGGDNAPKSNILGSIHAIQNASGFRIGLVGDEEVIKAELKQQGFTSDRLEIIHASQVISTEDDPIKAVRNKRDSSIVVGMKRIKEKSADVFLSAGDTGALMVAGRLFVKTIPGISRPALPALIPAKKGHVLLIDAGSNTICTPENLLQFAKMGSVYFESVMQVEKPTVGLLNVGTEDRKGPPEIRETFEKLSQSGLHFVGNIEGRDVVSGDINVVVCNGFVGNIVLKFFEGSAKLVFGEVVAVLKSGIVNKVCALLLKNDLKKRVKRYDYQALGGTLLFGYNGYLIKCHGSSTEQAIECSILKAAKLPQSDLLQRLKAEFKK